MIYYDNFSQLNVFEDQRLNVFFNQLFTSLVNTFNDSQVKQNLIVDGKVALILQEVENIPSKFTKIELSTSDPEIFRYLKVSSKMFTSKGILVSDELIILRTVTDHNIYFNFKKSAMETINMKGIRLRKSTEII